ncbi:molybdate transport system regulatory protein [Rhizobium azooxidifex]|uniref:Molybdate transport system regulatory protein n=1 Tax=Mycoplana azooxidifex TaxID=1636188 RepID=A0A7W6D7U3_9HYPH|nr:winged helix-turn-helix domain-containing protein [Mycoplana azooxidifex]MBB3975717.1 molybdate transport system regulatory protein [Mycoplana azooxidifex]
MTTSAPDDVAVNLRIDFSREDRLGRGKMMLLARIRETGSISAAGRSMDMSYRRAWLLVDTMNRMFSSAVVESQRGGKQGGGAVVTAFGEELLARFREMEAKARAAIGDDLDWLRANLSPGVREKQAEASEGPARPS